MSAQRFEALYAAGHEPAGGKRVQDRHQGQDQAEEGCCRHQLRQQEEIERAKAVTNLAREIISGGNLVLKAQVAVDNSISGKTALPKMLEG